MNFDESLAYLLALGNEVSAMKLGLENIEKLLAALGNPEKTYLKVQVAGTNGKGSTCAFLDAICRSARIKTALFTSPHLISITERIKINGAEIDEKSFARHASLIRDTAEKLVEVGELAVVPTFFEQITAIALNFFAERKIELAILETGLGGRFDATTAAQAEIAAVTPIDFDHQQILGNTLLEIASEKAAIIGKHTRQAVSSAQTEAVRNLIRERCANFNLMPDFADFTNEISVSKSPNFIVDFRTAKAEYADVRLNLAGRHQIENAETAVLLAEALQKHFSISRENIIEGLRTAEHKGRLELHRGILFDGAHNVAGARALRNFLVEFVKRPVTLIFGAMRDKDTSEIAAIIFPAADILIFTRPDNERSLEPARLTRFLPENFDAKKVFQTRTVEEALRTGEKYSPPENLICVTGSLYLVGEAGKLLNNKPEIFKTRLENRDYV